MNTTRISLLIRVRDRNDVAAWEEFTRIYRPLMVRFAQARGLGHDDAEDVAQTCLAEMAGKMDKFEYDRRRGGFKRWLRVTVRFRVRNLQRKRSEQLAESGDFRRPQNRERHPDEEFDRIWMQEHLTYGLKLIRPEFEHHTFEAFEMLVIREWPVRKVCEALGMNANQVYLARLRVSRRLRETMIDLLGEAA